MNENSTDGPRRFLALSKKMHKLTRAEADIIYLDRPDWKSPANKYRQAPWKLTGIPTVLKFDSQGAIVARIEDEDILDQEKLGKFLGKRIGGSHI